MNTLNEYFSDGVSPPGETLLEQIEDRGMTQTELAMRMGKSRKAINEIIKGKVSITPETALQLEMVLDIPASFWNKRERHYQEAKARQQQEQKLKDSTLWLKKIPYKDMIQRGWLPKLDNEIEIVKSILSYFGVVSPEQWQALWTDRFSTAFRKSIVYDIDEISVAAWLRKAELLASNIDCAAYDENKFREALEEIKSMTATAPTPELYKSQITELCRKAGVAVIIVKRLPLARVFGASQWASPRNAQIFLSLYHRTDDIFWFNFFHEAAHILLHSKKSVFVDIDDSEYANSKIEKDADDFAREFLIPTEKLVSFIRARRLTKSGDPFIGSEHICQFADELGIAPSIVVGRLQHDKQLNQKFNNQFKTYLNWETDDQIVITRPAEIC